MSEESTGNPQLSNGTAIEYKAYARKFGGESGAVLYLIATCAYPTGGYEIFFEAEYGLQTFKLMEIPPGLAPQLVTYYVASWTSSQRLVDPPEQVTMVDAHGEHRVAVMPWDYLAAGA